MGSIRFVLFDAANTIMHKPALWNRMEHALKMHGIEIDLRTLRKHHKIVSEIIAFPDRTSDEFYKKFNSELLYSLGVIPTEHLLNDIFRLCTYLPWETFDDASAISELSLAKGILSNFNVTLNDKINALLPNVFSKIITSEQMQLAKPNIAFYQRAIELLNIKPEQILFVGDSIKLDMEPALLAGMQAVLIDREDLFKAYPQRITSLSDLGALV